MSITREKKCAKCGCVFSYTSKAMQGYCRKCMAVYYKEWANTEHGRSIRKISGKRYRENHKELVHKYFHDWYIKNREWYSKVRKHRRDARKFIAESENVVKSEVT